MFNLKMQFTKVNLIIKFFDIICMIDIAFRSGTLLTNIRSSNIAQSCLFTGENAILSAIIGGYDNLPGSRLRAFATSSKIYLTLRPVGERSILTVDRQRDNCCVLLQSISCYSLRLNFRVTENYHSKHMHLPAHRMFRLLSLDTHKS